MLELSIELTINVDPVELELSARFPRYIVEVPTYKSLLEEKIHINDVQTCLFIFIFFIVIASRTNNSKAFAGGGSTVQGRKRQQQQQPAHQKKDQEEEIFHQ